MFFFRICSVVHQHLEMIIIEKGTIDAAVMSEPPQQVLKMKTLDETVLNLRCELRTLYESLSEKNNHLMLLERYVRERDLSIKRLRNEFHKLREHQCLDKKVDSQNDDIDSKQSNDIVSEKPESISELKKALNERDALIKELSEKIIRLSHDLSYVQRKSFAKDDKIIELQNEIDKFRQVVRPLTQAIFERKRSDSFVEWITPGVESTRILPMSEGRIKRQAISAEPLSGMGGMDGELVKVPKSSLSRELIKSAILDNDFMKNLDMTQIREIVDCMYP
ncbi:cGMP-dependent protein kinase, isozyme 2 forms cD4/T1/T3A/T3B, partial [Pseudolycoriella hygida]